MDNLIVYFTNKPKPVTVKICHPTYMRVWRCMIYQLILYSYGISGLIRGSVRLVLVSVTPWHICLRTKSLVRKFDKKHW